MTIKKKYNNVLVWLSKWLLYRYLNNHKRNPEIKSLKYAKKVGLTFIATSPAQLVVINKFIKELGLMGIQIFAVGYLPEKKPNEFFLSEKTINFFNDKELDWLYRLKNTEAIEFQNTEFDILIDINGCDYYPMYLLLQKSKAKLKVGQFREKNSPFDLMINIKKTSNLQFYFEQVIHYLLKFN